MTRSLAVLLYIAAAGCEGAAVTADAGAVVDAVAASPDAGPTMTDVSIEADGTIVLSRGDFAKPLRLVLRDGNGPFYVVLNHFDADPARSTQHPSNSWEQCTLAIDDLPPRPNTHSVALGGCRLRDENGLLLQGSIAFRLLLTSLPDGTVELDASVQNGLPTAVVAEARFLLRIGPSSLPDDGADTYALFGYDEWIRDPIAALRLDRVSWLHPHNNNGPFSTFQMEPQRQDRGHYLNRLNTKDMLSVHTPDWGLAILGTGKDNGVPGWQLMGSDGTHLEVGYHFRMPNDRTWNAGGAVGPTFRLVPAPPRRPTADAWWDAAAIYRAYLDEAGLVTPATLGDALHPAAWAQSCLYLAVSAEGKDAVDAAALVQQVREAADYFRRRTDGAPPESGVDVCVTLWGWADTPAPHVPKPGLDGFLTALVVLEVELDIDVHPMVYINPQIADYQAALATSLADAIYHDAAGQPQLVPYTSQGAGRQAVTVMPDHPAMLAEIERLRTTYGLDGFYVDTPFGEMITDYRFFAGPSAETHARVRNAVAAIAASTGVVVIEQSRMGIDATQQGTIELTAPIVLDSTPVPLTEALVHDRQINVFAGDLFWGVLGPICADAAATCCTGPACEPGVPGAARQAMRLAVWGVVVGRAVIAPPPAFVGTFYQPSTDPFLSLMHTYVGTLRRGFHLRRDLRALRTGVMLPTPPSDDVPELFAARFYDVVSGIVYPQVARRPVSRLATAFFQDVEAPDTAYLVIGNPTPATATVTHVIDLDAYPVLPGGDFVAIGDDGAVLAGPGRSLSVQLTVAGHDYRHVAVHRAP